MLRAFWKRQPTDDGQARALAEAKAKRNAALAEYREAREAGDTRRMHQASRSMRHATTDVVRLELGR